MCPTFNDLRRQRKVQLLFLVSYKEGEEVGTLEAQSGYAEVISKRESLTVT